MIEPDSPQSRFVKAMNEVNEHDCDDMGWPVEALRTVVEAYAEATQPWVQQDVELTQKMLHENTQWALGLLQQCGLDRE